MDPFKYSIARKICHHPETDHSKPDRGLCDLMATTDTELGQHKRNVSNSDDE